MRTCCAPIFPTCVMRCISVIRAIRGMPSPGGSRWAGPRSTSVPIRVTDRWPTRTAILISWALMMEGGVQINREGVRFSNELDGYSEQARRVLSQPGGIAWNLFDGRLRDLVSGFEDFKQAEAHGAVLKAGTVEELGAKINVPLTELRATLDRINHLASHWRERMNLTATSQPAQP